MSSDGNWVTWVVINYSEPDEEEIVLPGITFELRDITIPSEFAGDTQWVQTGQAKRRWKINDTWWKKEGAGCDVAGPDELYPYDTDTKTSDSPGFSWKKDDSIKKATVKDILKMYFMFKPDTDNSIWVPLKRIKWSWSAEASSNAEGTWTKDASNTSENKTDTTEFPTWDGKIIDDDFKWEKE